ncbi:glycosyltransferase family 2 protein [Sphingomonas sp. 1P06PA]|uniref:glycosyltransferase family 2 protein n=1 Tax=Sphingomonas sp. 1P06PA TaxID=554121 RepID=UPI0039A4E85C
MKFSICIPNYNYERYIGAAIQSVFDQTHRDFEICVADNASTDRSVEIVKGFDPSRIKLRINRCNVGFAGNLDKAASLADGDRMILLSSDDLLMPDALASYAAVDAAMGDAGSRAILNSTCHVIDSDGNVTGHEPLVRKMLGGAVRDEALTKVAGADVLRIDAGRLLSNSLALLRTPLKFLTTCYPRTIYEAVEGYANGRLINPDKYFSWKIMAAADEVIFIDRPLFSYRVHANNQGAIQARLGALKHLSDQYLSTFDLPDAVMARSGLDRDRLASAFIEQDIGLRGLHLLATGRRSEAKRGIAFGYAAYPRLMRGNRKVMALRTLLAAGPIGEATAKRLHARALAQWNTSLETAAQT